MTSKQELLSCMSWDILEECTPCFCYRTLALRECVTEWLLSTDHSFVANDNTHIQDLRKKNRKEQYLAKKKGIQNEKKITKENERQFKKKNPRRRSNAYRLLGYTFQLLDTDQRFTSAS